MRNQKPGQDTGQYRGGTPEYPKQFAKSILFHFNLLFFNTMSTMKI